MYLSYSHLPKKKYCHVIKAGLLMKYVYSLSRREGKQWIYFTPYCNKVVSGLKQHFHSAQMSKH